jgi:threonyl-tRNA synthetase
MKLLCWHCDFLGYQDRQRSNRPEGISDVVEAPGHGTFEDVLAVFVCVERTDSGSQVPRAVSTIESLAAQIGRKHIVLVPFAHLSGQLAEPKVAKDLLTDLECRLAKAGLEVSSISFGYHKDLELRLFRSVAHPGSVAFRDIN